MELHCTLDDCIKCTLCGAVAEIGKLVAKNGIAISKYDGTDKIFQQVNYYCPCGDKTVKVYDPGDGTLVVMYGAFAELIRKGEKHAAV